MFICICIYQFVYFLIYIYVYILVHLYMYIIITYIYIERERDKEAFTVEGTQYLVDAFGAGFCSSLAARGSSAGVLLRSTL